MSANALKDAFRLVEAGPEHAQAALAEPAIEMDREIRQGKYKATQAELAGIDRGIQAADAGRFTTDEQVEAVIAKYRPGQPLSASS
jgi:predicted transcriptional regulator